MQPGSDNDHSPPSNAQGQEFVGAILPLPLSTCIPVAGLLSFTLSKNTNIEIYKPIILLLLHGCETWSLTLWEEQIESVREQTAEENR